MVLAITSANPSRMFHPSYWIFTFIGILVSIVQVILTFYLLYKYILKSDTWKKTEYQLILFRVFLDAIIGVVGLVFFVACVPLLLYPESVVFEVTFVIAFISSHFLDMRSFLAAIIAIERVLVVMLPVATCKYRKKVSNYPIFGSILLVGIASYIVLLGVCGLRFPLDPRCISMICATPPCYHTYAFVIKLIYSTTNVFFSLLLCYKLFWLYSKQNQVPADIRKLNWLSLTDGLCILTLDVIPSLVINGILTEDSGPAMGAFRHSARAVEAAVMVKLMKKNQVANNS